MRVNEEELLGFTLMDNSCEVGLDEDTWALLFATLYLGKDTEWAVHKQAAQEVFRGTATDTSAHGGLPERMAQAFNDLDNFDKLKTIVKAEMSIVGDE